jgi:hypothetical protein
MTTLSDLTAQLADRRTVDRATAADLILDQIVSQDLILGQMTDPQDMVLLQSWGQSIRIGPHGHFLR